MKTFFFYTLLVLIDSETFSLSSVLVFPNKRKESTETSYTRFNVEKSPIEDLSFCFWLKVLIKSKYSMAWIRCFLGNVYIEKLQSNLFGGPGQKLEHWLQGLLEIFIEKSVP